MNDNFVRALRIVCVTACVITFLYFAYKGGEF
jgi:hypothetical protein